MNISYIRSFTFANISLNPFRTSSRHRMFLIAEGEEEDGLVLQDALIESRSSLYTGDESMDIKGQPVLKSPFVLSILYFKTHGGFGLNTGNQFCERLVFFGISVNLVSYLTDKLHQGNVSVARNVTTWQGTCFITPLIGAVLADSYCGFLCYIYKSFLFNVYLYGN